MKWSKIQLIKISESIGTELSTKLDSKQEGESVKELLSPDKAIYMVENFVITGIFDETGNNLTGYESIDLNNDSIEKLIISLIKEDDYRNSYYVIDRVSEPHIYEYTYPSVNAEYRSFDVGEDEEGTYSCLLQYDDGLYHIVGAKGSIRFDIENFVVLKNDSGTITVLSDLYNSGDERIGECLFTLKEVNGR